MSARRKSETPTSSSAILDAARASAQQRLDAFAQRAGDAGTPMAVGRVFMVLPARCIPLDHAAIAWAHASGVPAPPNATNLGAELVFTNTCIAYTTFPVPYVWWRRWEEILCTRAAVGRPRWRAGTASVFVTDRVPPFEGRAFELPIGAAKTFMDLAVQQGALSPGAVT